MKLWHFQKEFRGLFCLVSVFATASVQAAAFIKIGDIKGDSQVAGHEEEIEVLSWSWGVKRPVTSESGSTRTRANPEFLELEINKVLGKATPKLFEACVKGIVLQDATLVIEREDQGGGLTRCLR